MVAFAVWRRAQQRYTSAGDEDNMKGEGNVCRGGGGGELMVIREEVTRWYWQGKRSRIATLRSQDQMAI